jgi:WD40 repeat protein
VILFHVTWIDNDPNATKVIGRHDAPVRHVKIIPSTNSTQVVSGSWDKTVRVWDCRAPSLNQQAIGHLSERIFAMDSNANYTVVGISICLCDTILKP